MARVQLLPYLSPLIAHCPFSLQTLQTLGQLGEADALFFRTDRAEWHVMVPMRVWRRLLKR